MKKTLTTITAALAVLAIPARGANEPAGVTYNKTTHQANKTHDNQKLQLGPTNTNVDPAAVSAPPTTVTDANYQILSTDYVVVLEGATASRTFTLPAISTVNGKVFIVKDGTRNAGTYNLVVQRHATDTGGTGQIEGNSSRSITTDGGVLKLWAYGSKWLHIGETGPISGTISALLDNLGTTRGAMLYRGASGWAILAPGTSGHALLSNGSGADPSYGAVAGGSGGDIVAPLISSEVSITAAATATISKMHVASGTSADYQITLPAAAGNTDKWVGLGMSSALTKLITVSAPITEAGDAGNRMSAWQFSGATSSNTNSGVLYWQISSTTVTIFKDSAGSNSVASGTVSGGSATLAPTNTSGLSGIVSVTGSGDDTTVSANTLTWDAKIDGFPQRVLWAGEAALLKSDGTNWSKRGGKTIPMFAKMNRATSSTIPNNSTTIIPVTAVVSDPTGMMGDTTNNRISIKRTGFYDAKGGFAWGGVGASSQAAVVIKKNAATNVVVNSISTGASSFNGIAVAGSDSLQAGEYVDLAGYQNSGSSSSTNAGDPCFLTLTEVPTW